MRAHDIDSMCMLMRKMCACVCVCVCVCVRVCVYASLVPVRACVTHTELTRCLLALRAVDTARVVYVGETNIAKLFSEIIYVCVYVCVYKYVYIYIYTHTSI